MIFPLLANNKDQWRFRVQLRTIKFAANNSLHCTLATRPFPSQQRQAPERACITFSQISNHFYRQQTKMLWFFLAFRALPSWHAAATRSWQHVLWYSHFCCINNNSISVTFQHPKADNCRMLRRRANIILSYFLVQTKICVAFSCKNKIVRVFLSYNVCNNFFVVQLVQRKYLWRFYESKRNSAVSFSQIEPKLSYLAIGKAQLNACAFSDGVEKQKCCLEPGDIKTVITFLLYNVLIQNLAGCFLIAIAAVPVNFTFFPFLE